MSNVRSEYNAHWLYMYGVCGVWQIFDIRHRNCPSKSQQLLIKHQWSFTIANECSSSVFWCVCFDKCRQYTMYSFWAVQIECESVSLFALYWKTILCDGLRFRTAIDLVKRLMAGLHTWPQQFGNGRRSQGFAQRTLKFNVGTTKPK